MGAVTPETCRVTLQLNKSDCILLHLVGLLFNVNYNARNHELKICVSILFEAILSVSFETWNACEQSSRCEFLRFCSCVIDVFLDVEQRHWAID